MSLYNRSLAAQYVVLDLLSTDDLVEVESLSQGLADRLVLFAEAGLEMDFAGWAQGDLEDVLTKLICCGFADAQGYHDELDPWEWRKVRVLLTQTGQAYTRTICAQVRDLLEPYLRQSVRR